MSYPQEQGLHAVELPDPQQTPSDLHAQSLAYLTAGGRCAVLRNMVFLPLLRGKEYSRARAVSDAVVQAAPTDALGWRDRASLLLRDRDPEGAAKAMDQGLALSGDAVSSDVMAHGLQVYLAARQIPAAVTLAQRAQPHWGQNARLCQTAMTALYRSTGDAVAKDQAAEAAAQLMDHASRETNADQQQNWMLAAAPVLVAHGQSHAVALAFLSVGAGQSTDPKMLFELGRSIFLSTPGDASAAEYLNRCLEAEPDHKQARDLLARVALTHGQSARAVELLEAVPEENRSKVLRAQLARAYLANNAPTKAAATYAPLVEDDPDNMPLLRQYAGALLQTGETGSALEAYDQGLARRRARLSGSLVENIQALYQDPPKDAVPRHRMDWIYKILTAAGQAPADRQAWEDQLNILNRADHLLLDWIECKPEQREEFEILIGDQTQPRAALDEALAQGQGAFVVSAHLGLLFGGPLSLELAGYETAWIASVPKMGVGAADANLISTTTMDDAAIGRAVLKALRKGAVITIAIDGSANRQTVAYPLFDRQIKLSDFVPRLAYRRRVPTFFPRLPLVGAQLQATLIRMPDPAEGETVDEFTQRWMEKYLENIKRVFFEAPETLRGSGGFWTAITV